MHFGEYELSPSLIGLSLLPQGHPKAFQRLPVRPSNALYRVFSLPWGRSLGFASANADCAALFGLAFASAPGVVALSLAGTGDS